MSSFSFASEEMAPFQLDGFLGGGNLTNLMPIPEEVCRVDDDIEMGSGGHSSKRCHSTITSGKNLKRKHEELSDERKRLQWLPAESYMNLKVEFCPESIAHYANTFGSRRGSQPSSKLDVRNHLLYLGWEVHYAIDEMEVTRMRYISPEGEIYYSLYQACLTLQCGDNERQNDNYQAASFISSQIAEEQKEQNIGLSKIVCEKDTVYIEKEYCPQAVIEYSQLKNSKLKGRFKSGGKAEDLASKAKKHLAFVGWTFYNQERKGGRKETRYASPEGRKFCSLVTACQWWVSEGECSQIYAPSTKQVTGEAMLQFTCTANSSSPSVCMDVESSKKRKSKKPKVRRGRPKSTAMLQAGHSIKERNNVKAELSSCVLQLQTSKRVRQVAVSPTTYQNPRTFLSLLIDGDVILPGAKVHYRGKKDGLPMKEGKITREGIKCTCCQEVFTLSKFEAHAGSTLHRPSANIFLEDGRSILECQLQLKSENNVKNRKSEPHQVKKGNQHSQASDDICSVCHNDGELVLCDECPSSFHTSCLGLKDIPNGDWFCTSCCCRICGTGRRKEDKEQFADDSSINCGQCEHRYHIGCLKSKGLVKHDYHPDGIWFCNTICERIHSGLQKILGKPFPVGDENLAWTLLKYKRAEVSDKDALDNEHLIESHSKLNVALSIMHECFEPLKESRTGRDIVEDVIFSRWSELHRLNFQGFYTVILERNDELITVGTVRIYGEKVAEIPLVATRFKYRRLGMCRVLMDELEKKLMELGVERLVLPAVPSVLSTWETAFGFSQLKDSERLNFLDCTFLDFHGTIMCQKLLKKNIPSPECNISSVVQQKVGDHNGENAVDLDNANKVISEEFQVNRVEESEIADHQIPEPVNHFPEQERRLSEQLDEMVVDYISENEVDLDDANKVVSEVFQENRMEESEIADHQIPEPVNHLPEQEKQLSEQIEVRPEFLFEASSGGKELPRIARNNIFRFYKRRRSATCTS